MKNYKVDKFSPEKFSMEGTRGDITVDCKEFLYDPKAKKAMVRVVTAEENLTQNFWIKIVQDRGKWLIMLDADSGAVATQGVKKALELVYEAAAEAC